jgi:hypothetical protein
MVEARPMRPHVDAIWRVTNGTGLVLAVAVEGAGGELRGSRLLGTHIGLARHASTSQLTLGRSPDAALSLAVLVAPRRTGGAASPGERGGVSPMVEARPMKHRVD